MEYVIGRRNLLLSAGAIVAAGMTNATLAGAADEPAAPSKGPHQALIDAARACTSDGQACLAHCLAMFKSEYLVEWNLMMAAATVMLLPVVILFFVAQRYFVQGILLTGIKRLSRSVAGRRRLLSDLILSKRINLSRGSLDVDNRSLDH